MLYWFNYIYRGTKLVTAVHFVREYKMNAREGLREVQMNGPPMLPFVCRHICSNAACLAADFYRNDSAAERRSNG